MISTDVSQFLLYRVLQKQKNALSNLWLTRDGFCFKFVLLYIYISHVTEKHAFNIYIFVSSSC